MIKELNANLFVVLPQREQVIEVVERYDGYPLGKRKMDMIRLPATDAGGKKTHENKEKRHKIPEQVIHDQRREKTEKQRAAVHRQRFPGNSHPAFFSVYAFMFQRT